MTTIYYLSAAGNSLYAAKRIKQALTADGDTTELIAMKSVLQGKAARPSSKRIGLVMPLHFFGLPLLAEEFIRSFDWQETDYIFTVITCGWHYMSYALHSVNELLQQQGRTLQAGFYIDMLSIYLPLNDIPAAAKKEQRLQKADTKIDIAAQKIIQSQKHRDHEYLQLLSRGFHTYVKKKRQGLDKVFQATEECTGCAICEKICPTGNISLIDGKAPLWHHNCTQCLACLHNCPNQAIELGKWTKGKQRYRHPGIALHELV
jgi:ferredoxin/flavodoxin